MSDDEVAKREPTIMEVLQQIVNSPNARDQVEVAKELIALKERMEDREAERALSSALHQIQGSIVITKDGEIVVKGVVRSRYATIEQIDDVLKPLLKEHGLAFQISELEIKDDMREFAGTVRHAQGAKTTLIVKVPLDKSDFRSAIQSEGSTISYARRQLYKMHFNIVEHGEENPKDVEPIDADQLKDLETKMHDVNANKQIFCAYFHIKEVKDLKKADLVRAHEMLEQKRTTRPKKNESPRG